MKYNFKKLYVNRLALTFLVIITLITQSLGGITAYAAATFTISPKYVNGSLSKRITITSSENSFTDNESTPYIMKNGSVVGSASISSINSSSNEVSFTLGAGLSDGEYDIRIVDPKETYDVGSITVGEPSIDSISPVSISKDYSDQEIVVTGENTNFTIGKTSIEILDSNDNVVNYVDSITEVNNSTNLTFKLKDGLSSGSYSIRFTTDDEIVTEQDTLEVRGNASISLSQNSLSEGYSTDTINVTGTNTGFSQSQTTVSIIGQSSKVGMVNVSNENSLSFSLNSGLNSGVYTVEIKTGSEELQGSITINSASAQIQYQGSNLSEIPAGYNSAYSLLLKGIGTSFSSGITQLSLYDGDPDSGDNDITSTYISSTNVSSSTNISFELRTGLDVGTYYVRAVTGNQVVEDSFSVDEPQITSVKFNSDIVNDDNVPQGYKKMTVDIVGQNTLFNQGSTTVKIQEASNKTETVIVEDSTHLSFSLKEGLSEGRYTIVVDIDGNDTTTTDQAFYSFEVTSPSIESVSPNTIINIGNTPINMTVIGENTHFTTSTPNIDIIEEDNEAISNIEVINDTKLTFNIVPYTLSTKGNYSLEVTTSNSFINEAVTGNYLITVKDSGISKISPSSIYIDELGTKEITITGLNTNFTSESTTVEIDNNTINNILVDSPIELRFTIPNEGYLTQGVHTIKIVDADSNEFTSTILIDERSISISPNEKDFAYDEFTMTVTGDGLAFNTNDKKPTVEITGYGEVDINDSDIKTSYFTFEFPDGFEGGTYTVTVTWNGIKFIDTFTINGIEDEEEIEDGDLEDISPGGGGGGTAPIEEEISEDITDVIIEEKKLEDGTIINKITLSEEKTIESIKNSNENNYLIQIEKGIANADVNISSKIIQELKGKGENTKLTIKTDKAEYELPTDIINLEEIKKSLNSEDVNIAVIIKEPGKQIVDKMKEIVVKENIKLLAEPVEFKIEASSGNNKIEINNFKNRYVNRKITLNNTVDVKNAVGAMFNEKTNTYIHVPTKFYKDEDGNLVAVLKKKGNSIYTVIQNKKSFEDMKNHWAKNNVETLASKLVISGMTETEFAPDNKITRAQFAALLVRALGLESSSTNVSEFADIAGNEWFVSVVNTAAEEGLVTGYDDKTFKPNKTISREEMAIMVVRALNTAGKDTKISENEKNNLLAKFDDKGYISSWAEKEVANAVKEGIISGKTSNTFVPKDNATRAEAATMLIRMMKSVDFVNN